MKKAKILLSAIAVLAVVGGAFAFSAKKFQNRNVWTITTTVGGETTCVPTLFRTSTAGLNAVVFTTEGCPVLTSTKIIPANL